MEVRLLSRAPKGRLAQLVRATRLHRVGHRFESCSVHQKNMLEHGTDHANEKIRNPELAKSSLIRIVDRVGYNYDLPPERLEVKGDKDPDYYRYMCRNNNLTIVSGSVEMFIIHAPGLSEQDEQRLIELKNRLDQIAYSAFDIKGIKVTEKMKTQEHMQEAKQIVTEIANIAQRVMGAEKTQAA
jgi:hypothetical protein